MRYEPGLSVWLFWGFCFCVLLDPLCVGPFRFLARIFSPYLIHSR